MKIEKIKPGMTVYETHSHRAGNTVLRTWGVWDIRVISVDLEKQTVFASWNGNQPKKFYHGAWSKWREKEPMLVKTGFGMYRPPTREERKALLAKEATV